MKNERINPTTANEWDISRALARAVRPYSVGSSYGSERAEVCDGRTVVYGLSSRSKNHATGREVVNALNAAHLEALGLGLAGRTNGDALFVLLPQVLHLSESEANAAAVLLCDLFGIDAFDHASSWDVVQPSVRRLAQWNSDASQWEDVVQTVQAACAVLR